MNIGTLTIGPGEPCALIAEIGNAHNGSFDRAIRLLDAAKVCGASAAKLQTYTPDELVALRGDGPAPEPWGSQGFTMSTLYEKARTPLGWIPHLFDHASAIGLPLFSSVFGRESFDVLQSVGCPAYKLAALDREHVWLQDLALSSGKPVLASVPRITDIGWANRIKYLYCPSGYPQNPKNDMGLSRALFDGPFIGFSYHGTDTRPPMVAAWLGAQMVEFHFHLASEPNALEAHVSLNEADVAGLVRAFRDARRVRVVTGR